MADQAPVLEAFFTRHGGAWRLYVAPTWCPPMLRDRLDDELEALLAKAPDLDDLERHMWAGDAPYRKSVAKLGGVEIEARGRAAIVLATWIDGLLSL